MATTNGSHLFVDTNVLIYATDPRSPFNHYALESLGRARAAKVELMISPQILRDFLAAATRASLSEHGSPLADILRDFRIFRSIFTILVDSPIVLDHLDQLVSSISVAGKQIHDANIVATMQTYNIRTLLTHNTSDFARFAHLITVMPLVPVTSE